MLGRLARGRSWREAAGLRSDHTTRSHDHTSPSTGPPDL